MDQSRKTDEALSHKMQPMTAKEAAGSILAHIYRHVDAFRASPPRKAEQFAAAGLMRCCALLKGILVLDEARMPALAGILVRQHLDVPLRYTPTPVSGAGWFRRGA